MDNVKLHSVEMTDVRTHEQKTDDAYFDMVDDDAEILNIGALMA